MTGFSTSVWRRRSLEGVNRFQRSPLSRLDGWAACSTSVTCNLSASPVPPLYLLALRRIGDVLNRIHIAMPKQREGERLAARPPVIPPGVAEARKRREAGEKRRPARQLQEENGGAGERPKGGRLRGFSAGFS